MLQFAVEGDLRFCSHLDCVRCVERTAARASVALRFSQGFNPHPVLSLAYAKPVGVTGLSEVLALTLDEAVHGPELLERMNAHAPEGMSFLGASLLEARHAPRPRRITYRLDLSRGSSLAVSDRLAELRDRPAWPVERRKVSPNRRKPSRSRSVDLKRLIESIEVDSSALRWTARPDGELWPRVSEVLGLLGLDARADQARVVRRIMDI